MEANLLKVNLALFGDAEAGTGTEAADSKCTANEDSAEKVGENNDYGSDRRKKDERKAHAATNATASKPAKQAEAKASSDAPEDKRAEFERLIKGEYRDIFTERTQQIIDRRFAETKSLKEKLDTVSPILELLSEKYRISPDNINEIAKAIEKDDTYWEQMAEEAGISVDKYKYMRKLERENSELRKQYEQEERRAKINEIYKRWSSESEEVSKAYPDFEFKSEYQNPKFRELLMSGIDVRTAYEVLHMDDIKTDVAQNTAKSVEQSVINNIRAKGNRPTENGVASQGGVIVKSDVSKLTRPEREEMARRALRGEVIRF